jgi:hypothetical protein
VSARKPGRPRSWSRSRILGAALRWHAEYGRKPTSDDWRVARPGYPCTATVMVYFESWRAMYVALGWPPNPQGPTVRRPGRVAFPQPGVLRSEA